MNKLTVSSSPHIRSGATTQNIMLDVIIALVPAFIASIAIFGIRAALVVFVCVASCVLAEFLWQTFLEQLDAAMRSMPSEIGDIEDVYGGFGGIEYGRFSQW